jgi:hypothetical protein
MHRFVLEGSGDDPVHCVSGFDVSNGSGSASVTKINKACKGRNIKALVTVRRIPQLNSWADIQLLDYTTRESTVYKIKNPMVPNEFSLVGNRDQKLIEGILSNNPVSYKVSLFRNIKGSSPVKIRQEQQPANKSISKGVILGSQWKHGQQTMKSQRWDNRGFTYFQASLEDLANGQRQPAACITLTLYHSDVIRYAGEKEYRWLDIENSGYGGTMGIKSVKIPNTNFYKVNIRLRDSGDWLKEANLVAYLYVRP